jgi:hypothetical protein
MSFVGLFPGSTVDETMVPQTGARIVKRSVRRFVVILGALAAGACGETDLVGTDVPDVTGLWTGSLLFDITGEGLLGGELSLQLVQNEIAVTGTQSDFEGDTGTVSGLIAGNTLTLEWLTDDSSADCVPFKMTLVFTVSNSALDLTTASGQICSGADGDKFVTNGQGKLFRK